MKIVGLSKIGLLLLLLIAAACGDVKVEPEGPAHTIVQDDLGRSVKLPGRIERIVSLAPSATEMVFAAGAGDRLVGVTTYCNFPEAAKTIEKVGDTQTPNIERIIALKPDVILVSTASQLEAFSTTLNDQGISVYVMDAKGINEVIEDLQKLGKIFETEGTAHPLASALRGRVDVLERTSGPEAGQRVFIQISNEPLFSIGKESFLTEVVRLAGGWSVTEGIPTAYPKLSKETASAMNPNVIILSDSEDNKEPNPVFNNSDAVKRGRVFRINADIISRPGPRLIDAAEEIFRHIRTD